MSDTKITHRIPGLSRIAQALPLGTLDRYLIRQFAIAYVMCAVGVLTLFMLIEGVQKLDSFMNEDAPLWLVFARYFSATVPRFFTQYLGPVLTLMASLFSITTLNKGSELIPMRASGLSIQRILASHFLMATVAALFMVGVQELVIPNLKDSIRTALSYTKHRTIHPPKFLDSQGNLIDVSSYQPKTQQGWEVQILQRDKNGDLTQLISAKKISWDRTQEVWTLDEGFLQSYDPRTGEPLALKDLTNNKSTFNLPIENQIFQTEMRPIDLESGTAEVPYLSYVELRNQYKRRPKLTHLEVKLHMRFAFPLANFILLLLGLPLVLRRENQSVLIGVGITILLSAGYLFLMAVCGDLGNKGDLPPVLAAWLPVLLFGALGVTLFSDLD